MYPFSVLRSFSLALARAGVWLGCFRRKYVNSSYFFRRCSPSSKRTLTLTHSFVRLLTQVRSVSTSKLLLSLKTLIDNSFKTLCWLNDKFCNKFSEKYCRVINQAGVGAGLLIWSKASARARSSTGAQNLSSVLAVHSNGKAWECAW